ncbi:SGNH/GDSL hydrolase family protein [Nocardioides jejuensis]|uniref:SGNH/GDSL hydrolase family protein n=1 Tax=Nocardioides jejuensis TaxID=2502782 RepID=A0A4R1CFQ2_9ACTN|nr:SGNH/GDSL hydrolase family protein [Nocardioides jejuensis]TCJ30010.1 SGNH/GDSL hydrolase family protein [Nocardioides jejuensis]
MGYVRFAALGDSVTHGVGDAVPTGWRGWARILAEALGESHDISFCNLAVSGAVVADVRHKQLPEALAHQPHIASLIVGINDTMRSTWNRERIRRELLETAAALHGSGAVLLTVRFHDHGRVFGLPAVLRRPLFARIAFLNEVYDEIHATYGGIRVDLGEQAEVFEREFWSIDRLHPSELGHRSLARCFGAGLNEIGFAHPLPSGDREGGYVPNWRTDLHWMVTEGVPWFGRRAKDLGPWAARLAMTEARGLAQRPVLPARLPARRLPAVRRGVLVGVGLDDAVAS